jgi:hypothetical protein
LSTKMSSVLLAVIVDKTLNIEYMVRDRSMCVTLLRIARSWVSGMRFQTVCDVTVTLTFLIVLSFTIYNGSLAVTMFTEAVGSRSGTEPLPYVAGGTIPTVAGLDFDASGYTVLLVIRSTCRYCTESMGFYKSLTDLNRSIRSDVRFVAVCPEDQSQCQTYLRNHAVVLDQVVSFTPGATLNIRATPTVMIVDRKRTLLGIWVGLQRDAGQREIRSVVSRLS